MHMVLGSVGILAFIASGQYMDLRLDHLRGMADAPRLLFRSAHIYLLLSALLNLVLGIYFRPARTALRRGAQSVGSALIAAGPPLFVTAFISEPWLQGLARPYGRAATYTTFAGALLHLAGTSGSRALRGAVRPGDATDGATPSS